MPGPISLASGSVAKKVSVDRRARHPLLAPSGRAPVEEAGALDRRRRAGRDDAPLRPRHRRDRAAVAAGLAGHLIKTQLLEPHWEKKAAEVIALERATLYGIVIYSNRRVDFGTVDPAAAREIFIREALVAGEWETKLPFLAANRKLIAQVEELEHKSRRQDVLVDDELIFAFYDQQLPADVLQRRSASSAGTARRPSASRKLADADARRADAPRGRRHHDRGASRRRSASAASTARRPTCTSPAIARDGVTVTVPIYALNQASEERCEWLVPGMLKDKVVALAKTLPQRPRSRLVPLPEYAECVHRRRERSATAACSTRCRACCAREDRPRRFGAPTSSTSSCRRTC